MYELPLNLDRDVSQLPPIGQWRVVDFVRWNGPVVCVVGDYTDFSAAMDQLRCARYPYTRRVINDMGVEVAGFTPGEDGVPQAGAES